MAAHAISRVPTNLITGFLGVGKSTAIRELLARAPAGERWAVLVNEFGEVGVDAAAIGGDERAVIQELPGGCMCCTLGAPLKVTLTRLLRQARPDRLLIEPTGVGHPARVLDTLRTGDLAPALDVRATVCLIDPRQLADERITGREVFQDQVELAEVLVANKADLCDAAAVAHFREWAVNLFPPKARVAVAERGQLDPAWLELPSDPGRTPLYPQAHAHEHAHDHGHVVALGRPEPGQPLRYGNTGQGLDACGWIFDPADRFEQRRLLAVLEEIPVERLKGVFRCDRWLHVDRVGTDLSTRPSAWRADSRVECIAREGAAPDWAAVGERLRACLSA
ncbi:MAG: GTP-binding protein [Halofilum sp. (in: g-proteobacteria)]